MMLVPVAKIDLYELANNSIWRARFGFRQPAVRPPPYMNVETDAAGLTEWGWLNFGFETYYLLLNRGFRLQPTAGTASGVHPVPLGHSRVYVHVGPRFDSQAWLAGLRQGRSFVTTGPMLLATLDDALPGEQFQQRETDARHYRLHVESISEQSMDRIEVLVNGRVVHAWHPTGAATKNGNGRQNANREAPAAYTVKRRVSLPITTSSWIAVRSFQIDQQRRVRFAHTAPWHIEIANRPIRPRREEAQYLVQRMREEIIRNEPVLPEEALDEFRQALRTYESILDRKLADKE